MPGRSLCGWAASANMLFSGLSVRRGWWIAPQGGQFHSRRIALGDCGRFGPTYSSWRIAMRGQVSSLPRLLPVCPLPRLGLRANDYGASWHTGARGGATCDSSQIAWDWQYAPAKLYLFFTNPTLGLVFTANRGHSRNASFALRHSAIGVRHLGRGRHRPVAKADAAWTGRSVPGTGGL